MGVVNHDGLMSIFADNGAFGWIRPDMSKASANAHCNKHAAHGSDRSLCSAYTQGESCCSAEQIRNLESLVKMDAPTHELRDLWEFKELKAMGQDFGWECQAYLEDRAGCLRCHFEYDKYLSYNNATGLSEITMCKTWQERYEKACKKFYDKKRPPVAPRVLQHH
jgi:hypothetical protein